MNTIKLNTIGTPFPKAEGGGGDTPSGGGSASENTVHMKYYDVDAMMTALDADKSNFLPMLKTVLEPCTYLLARVDKSETSVQGIQSFSVISSSIYENVSGLALLYGVTIVAGSTIVKITPEFVISTLLEGLPLDQFEITEEEFYNTTA